MFERLCLCSVLAALTACTTSGSECENTLTLRDQDQGSMQSIDDGCTSLVIALEDGAPADWAAMPTVSSDVLRFDYRYDGGGLAEYYFTPMRDGEAQIDIGRAAATSWSSTVRVDLPQ